MIQHFRKPNIFDQYECESIAISKRNGQDAPYIEVGGVLTISTNSMAATR